MAPEHLRFGGGTADTTLHPLVVLWMLIAIALMLILPRGKAITPFLLAFFTIPIGQVVVLGGLHFTVLRILILAGLARMVFLGGAGEKFTGGFNRIDKVVALWTLSALVAFLLEFKGESQAIVNGLGNLIDTLGGYLLVRFLVPDGDAVRRTIKTMGVVCAILGICMINEQITHVNVFGLLGGMPTAVVIRNGNVRSTGTLGCLYAGAFAGVLIPLFLWMWKEKSRLAALIGLCGATAMVVTSYSSTSWLAFMGGFIGLAFWPLRERMRLVRWGLVSMLVALHMVMKAPVWALIARIDLTGSSSGDQRFMLVDMTIRHFSDWWLIGTTEYVNWGWDSWDLCNQFVAVALTGGLLTLIFYMAIFSRGFSAIGKARKQVEGNRQQEWLLWSFGSALFATVMAHFGINYMAQLIMGFFPLIASISVVAYEATKVAETAGATIPMTETPAQVQLQLAPYRSQSSLPLANTMRKASNGISSLKKDRPSWLKV
jgi:hypothetical protein